MPSRLVRPGFGGATIAALLVALTLSGCTGSNGSSPTSPTSSTSSTSSTASIPPPSGTVSGPPSTAPATGGTLPLGAKWQANQFASLTPYLHSLSGASTWYELVWCNVQHSAGGPINWDKADSIVQHARQVGITTMIKIRVGTCWTTGGTAAHQRGNKTESGMPKDLAAYQAFVQQVVKRYSGEGVKEYAIENEVNSPGYFSGTPADYDKLARSAASAIRAADSSAVVVDPGISSVASGYAVVDSLLKAGQSDQGLNVYNLWFAHRFGTRGDQINKASSVAQLRQYLTSDVATRDVAFAEEANKLAAAHVVGVRQVHFYESWQALPYLLNYLHAHTPADLPLQMWELGLFGGGSLSPSDRTTDVVKATVLALRGGMRKVLWLPLMSDPNGRVAGNLTGLLAPSAQATGPSRIYAAMAGAARGATLTSIAQNGVVGVGFDKGQTGTAFVWASGPTVAVSTKDVSKAAPLTASGPGTPTSGTSLQIGSTPIQVNLTSTVSSFASSLK